MAVENGARFIRANFHDRRTKLFHFYGKNALYSHSAYALPSEDHITGYDIQPYDLQGYVVDATKVIGTPSHVAYLNLRSKQGLNFDLNEFVRLVGNVPKNAQTTAVMRTDEQGNPLKKGKK